MERVEQAERSGGGAMCATLRVYCELVAAEAMHTPDVRRGMEALVASLRRHGWGGRVDWVVKVTLPTEAQSARWDASPEGRAVLRLVCEAASGDLPGQGRLWLWGQLAERDVVYFNIHSAPQVLRGWTRLRAALDRAGAPLPGVCFDLEPERWVLQAWFDGRVLQGANAMLRRGGWRSTGWDDDARALQAAVDALGAPAVLAACAPVTALGPRGARWAGRALGTPLVDAAGHTRWAELACMDYTSLILPALGGAQRPLARAVAARLGGWVARRHVALARATGARAEVICGLTGVGIFGAEPTYPTPHSMASVLRRIARARPDALAVFNLAGLLAPPGPWRRDSRVHPDRVEAWGAVLAEAMRG